MNNKDLTKQLTIASLMIALGIILPLLTHSIAAGPVLLPMHIPVIIAGFILKPKFALLVGVLTPILSSVLTGMPPSFPMLPVMIFELGTYALVTSILFNKYKVNVYIVIIIAMIVGRIVAGITMQALIIGFDVHIKNGYVFITSAISTGLIGIGIQLLIIPPIIYAIKNKLK